MVQTLIQKNYLLAFEVNEKMRQNYWFNSWFKNSWFNYTIMSLRLLLRGKLVKGQALKWVPGIELCCSLRNLDKCRNLQILLAETRFIFQDFFRQAFCRIKAQVTVLV